MKKLFEKVGTKNLIAAALAGLLVAGLVLAATGGLPDGVQDGLANAVDNVGVDLPGGDKRLESDAQERRSPGPARRTAAPRSFPSGSPAQDQPESGIARYGGPSRSYGGEYYDPQYSEEYYEYYGYPNPYEDDADDGITYVPPPSDDDGGGYGQPGEPGGPGYGGGNDAGGGGGTGGEGGPGGAGGG